MQRATPKVRTDAQIAMSRRLAQNWARIRAWIESKNGGSMTIREIAKFVGLPKTSIGNLESGNFGTQIDTLVPIAECIGMDVWMLLVPDFDPANPPLNVPRAAPKKRRETTEPIAS